MVWEKLGSHTLGSAGANLTVSGMAAKKHLKVYVHVIGTSGNVPALRYRFNDDSSGTGGSSGTYAHRNSNNSASDDTGNWKTEINPINQDPDSGTNVLLTMDIVNVATLQKLVWNECVAQKTAGAGTIPNRTENAAKWNNTSDSIAKIVVWSENNTNFDTGSSMVVYGGEGSPTVTYPNLPNGAIFEESETGTHYMWDGTDTWNEVT